MGVAAELDAAQGRLADALFASLGVIPMWRGFLKTACAEFDCDHAALVIEPGGGDLPAVFADCDAVADRLEPLQAAGLLAALPQEQPRERTDIAGFARALTLSVDCDPGARAHLSLWRLADRRTFGKPADRVLRGLMPDLRRGVGLYFQIAQTQRRLILSTMVIESAGMGIVLADQEGRIVLTNVIADELLAAADGLAVSRGRLKALAPADTVLLLQHIRAKAAEQAAEIDWRNYEPMALPRPGKDLPLTAIIRPGPAFSPLKNPLRRTAVLILRDPERQTVLPTHSVARLFGLTRSEALLASELGRGHSLEDAAIVIGISRNTARAQLQAIFTKTGTNSQKELVRILLSSAASLSK
jgi:DNA-binding CsgD family transcriptional regulator